MDYSKMGAPKAHKGVPKHKPKGGERNAQQAGRASKEELLARMKKAAEARKAD
ncbi:hypothetical protein SAMN06297129_2903 [Pseudooceanicola antarcticus]|uniref:Uncharacterized protein n=1 Tax=Pseudooceanicola antarcticus TaxID=1247613 RepID=A0A285J6P7_9RHOB|nr:hypothetical protein [Pseudooceanicola antarcticus]SNY54771.1 hypothetical protein SAMN06297129_2903 [Pseudooceanicola antarcticus]